jgi:hypothetical protein
MLCMIKHKFARAMDHPSSSRPIKKVRFVDPNETTIRNVVITRKQMEGEHGRTSTDGPNRKRLRGTVKPEVVDDGEEEFVLPYLAQDNPVHPAITNGGVPPPPVDPEPADPCCTRKGLVQGVAQR